MTFKNLLPEGLIRTSVFLILILLTISNRSFCQPSQYTGKESTVYSKALQKFAENFKPTYYVNQDTLVVSVIPALVDSMNAFVYYCIDHQIHSVDKFAYLIILKLKQEFILKNRSDYDFCNYSHHGIIDLIRDRMKKPYDEIGCSFFKTYDVYLWVKKHPETFKNYVPLLNQVKKIDKLLK